MDERVRRTLETYEDHAESYAEATADRSAVQATLERSLFELADASDAAERSESPTDGGIRILDVGCGSGWDSETFAAEGCDVVSLDLSASLVRQTRSRVPETDPVRGDMRELPLEDDAIDGLWACASLLHVPRSDVIQTLAEFERVLGSGGAALVTLKRTGGEAGTEGRFGGDRHFERYEPADVRERFDDAGFDAVEIEAIPEWLTVAARVD